MVKEAALIPGQSDKRSKFNKRRLVRNNCTIDGLELCLIEAFRLCVGSEDDGAVVELAADAADKGRSIVLGVLGRTIARLAGIRHVLKEPGRGLCGTLVHASAMQTQGVSTLAPIKAAGEA